jgi:sigma-B regulation protein RsbU (phosphoserine phosphatase)
MRTQQPLLAGDLQAGDLGARLPEWMQAEGFRGHAAVPLIVEGRSLGVLVLNSRQPRRVDPDEVRFLRLVANQAALALEQARLRQEALQRQRYEQELALGRQIQLSLLPRGCPALAGWECAATYQPARIVGGDFYDFFELPLAGSGSRKRLGVVIADVADKGVPAALFMALSRTMIRTAALGGRLPAVALARASELIRKDSRSNLFVTACYGILDLDSGRLSYANGGHHPPLWFRNAAGEVRRLPGRGIALGVVQQAEIDEEEIEIAPGDLVVFYTDGVTEAMDGQRRQFGDQELRDVISSHAPRGAQAVLDAVVAAVAAHRGDSPQSDDLTLFVLRRQL